MVRSVPTDWIMFQRLSLWSALLSATAAMAAAQDFQLGVNYSELIPTGSLATVYQPIETATDSQGAIYLLVNGIVGQQSSTVVYYLMKLTPAGDRVVYQTLLTFQPLAMAVDPGGKVYLAGNDFVQKVGTDGKTVVYTTKIAQNAYLTGLAVDPAGRAYVTGWLSAPDLQTTPGALQQTPPRTASGSNSYAFVVRLKPAGAVDYATYLGGTSQAQPVGIAVDASGSALVTGLAFSASFPTTPGAYLAASGISNFVSASFLARLSPDGATLVYSTFTDAQGAYATGVAVDAADNAVVLLVTGAHASASLVLRFNPEGTAAAYSRLLPAAYSSGLAVDTAGHAYVAVSAAANYAVKNSLAPCGATGTAALTVLDVNGDILQSTYIAGSTGAFYSTPIAVGLGLDSTIYVVAFPDATYLPTQQLAGPPAGLLFLTSLSQNLRVATPPLACVGNAASYDSTGIAGGEIVSLFGQRMGPATGVEPQVSAQTGFPMQLADVQVTFNDIPGPLLYVQDGQINAIAPWALQASQTVRICVVYNSSATNCLTRPVVAADPGVFTVDGYDAAALNQDGTLNSSSNPAKVGSIVTIFATGLGPISPSQPDGGVVVPPLPANVLAAQLFWYQSAWPIGLIPMYLTVKYAGPAPYEVAGVSQINFAADFTNGTYVPLYLVAGGQTSAGFQVYVAQ
jgi:uncharacterized protein (TIGR03437 family)